MIYSPVSPSLASPTVRAWLRFLSSLFILLLERVYSSLLFTHQFLHQSHNLPPAMSSPYPVYGNPRPGSTPDLYPPNPSLSPSNSSSTIHGKHDFVPDRISRTPSPTPSEAAELARTGLFEWKAMASWRFWLRREWFCTSRPFLSKSYPTNFRLGYYVIGTILTVITTLTTIYHHQIVETLTPAGHWMKR